MSDWLDDFQMMGTKLNQGEKSLMRFAMKKERERIIKLLETKSDQAMQAGQGKPMPERMEFLAVETSIRQVIDLIKNSGNQK